MARNLTQDIVEWIDPDWSDHFADVETAAEFYQLNSDREWRVAYREVTGEEWDDDL
jgi:hypothetical protein